MMVVLPPVLLQIAVAMTTVAVLTPLRPVVMVVVEVELEVSLEV